LLDVSARLDGYEAWGACEAEQQAVALGVQGVGVLHDGEQGRVLGLLPSAAEPDALERERPVGAGAVEAVDEEGGSGGAAGAEAVF